jgi:2-polyprenyl-6-methoxyphenol hydroxylase-like FAD-dependent oxidoreductase
MKLENAVVIGGSIAGILAARVLAEHFESVTIVETDKLPLQPQVRIGVPQSAQPHILLTGGYRILEELFPEIGSQLIAAGALPVDFLKELHFFRAGQWSPSGTISSDFVSVTCSRPLLEWVIRQRLKEFSQVHFVEQHRVESLLSNSSKTQITGVSIRSLTGDGVKQLHSNLVVDASGRRTRAPEWLESLGLATPSSTVIDPFLGYATRLYKQPQDTTDDWKVILISQEPPDNKRLGYLAKIEGGRWIATLGGYGRDFPSLDDQGFLEFARSLSSPKFYETIKNAEPISPIYAHRATKNRLYHYEKIQTPRGFIALGDAVCALCPVYGQGMTVSALSAVVLKDWLSDGQFQSSRFQQKLAKSNSFAWTVATQMDLSFPTTSGGKTRKPNLLSKILTWYSQQVVISANSNVAIQALNIEIFHLLKSPLALYHPQVIFQVLIRNKALRHQLAQKA